MLPSQETVGWIKADDTKSWIVNKFLNDSKKQLESLYKEKGYVKLYDDNGAFINWKKPDGKDDGNCYNELGEQISCDDWMENVRDIANNTDQETLQLDLIDAYIDLLVKTKMAGRNIDVVRNESNSVFQLPSDISEYVQDFLPNFDIDADDLDNDKRQWSRVIQKNDIFGISGLLDYNYLTTASGSSIYAEQYNKALNHFHTLLKAHELNMDPSKTEADPLLKRAWNNTVNALSNDAFTNNTGNLDSAATHASSLAL